MKKATLLILVCLVGLFAVPFLQIDARNYILQILLFLFLSIVLAQSYDIVGGYMGYINLGHTVFFALGAYTFGILFNKGQSVFVATILSVVISVLFAGLISYPFFRLRGAYFSLATFGLVQLMLYATINLGWLTGGSNGLKIEPGNRTIPVYNISLMVVVAVIMTTRFISRSRLGLALKSIREDEEVAQDFGVPTYKTKTQALMISAIFPGIMGAIYTWNINFIATDQVYGLKVALNPIAMALLGGTGLIVGPIIGATILYTAEELLLNYVAHLHAAMLGAVIVFVGLFMPGGVARLKPVQKLLKSLGILEDDK